MKKALAVLLSMTLLILAGWEAGFGAQPAARCLGMEDFLACGLTPQMSQGDFMALRDAILRPEERGEVAWVHYDGPTGGGVQSTSKDFSLKQDAQLIDDHITCVQTMHLERPVEFSFPGGVTLGDSLRRVLRRLRAPACGLPAEGETVYLYGGADSMEAVCLSAGGEALSSYKLLYRNAEHNPDQSVFYELSLLFDAKARLYAVEYRCTQEAYAA